MRKIIKDLTIEAYHYEEPYIKSISSTGLKKADNSLKLFKDYQDSKTRQGRKVHFDFGNAFEIALVEPKEFLNKVSIFDGNDRPEPEKTFGSKENKAWKLDFEMKAINENKYIIHKSGDHSIETVQYMKASCEADPTIKALLSNIEYQYSFFWDCPETGLALKTRPDISIVNKNNLIDIKTCDDASPRAVSKAISNFGYATQACMQIDGVQQCSYIKEVDNYFWLFVEKKAPYDAVLYEFSKEDRSIKMAEYKRTLKRVANAISKEHYPGYKEFSNNKYGILTAKIW